METSVNRISDKTTAVTDSHIAVASVLTANGDKSQKLANPFFLNVPDKLSAKIKENDIYDEKAIVIFDATEGKKTTISEESEIIKTLTEKIDIMSLYCNPSKSDEALAYMRKINEAE